MTRTGSPIFAGVPLGRQTETVAGEVTEPVPSRSSFDSACCWIQAFQSPPGSGELPSTAARREPSAARWLVSSQ